jgi:hypothetical protein
MRVARVQKRREREIEDGRRLQTRGLHKTVERVRIFQNMHTHLRSTDRSIAQLLKLVMLPCIISHEFPCMFATSQIPAKRRFIVRRDRVEKLTIEKP